MRIYKYESVRNVGRAGIEEGWVEKGQEGGERGSHALLE